MKSTENPDTLVRVSSSMIWLSLNRSMSFRTTMAQIAENMKLIPQKLAASSAPDLPAKLRKKVRTFSRRKERK